MKLSNSVVQRAEKSLKMMVFEGLEARGGPGTRDFIILKGRVSERRGQGQGMSLAHP